MGRLDGKVDAIHLAGPSAKVESTFIKSELEMSSHKCETGLVRRFRNAPVSIL